MMTIDHELDRLNSDLGEYQRLSGKTQDEVLVKQGGKLAFALRKELRGLAPVKGSIRAAALARLRAGGGVKVRESVRRQVLAKQGAAQTVDSRQFVFGKTGQATKLRKGRRLNLQALMVEAEINVRERGRGFLSVSSNIPRFTGALTDLQRAYSRFGPILSQAGLHVLPDRRQLRFDWGGFSQLSESAAVGLTKPKAQIAVARALQLTAQDIEIYLDRKLTENANASFTKAHRR